MHLSLQDGWTALMMASEAGHMECVKVLLDKGAEVNKQNKVSDVIIHSCSHSPIKQHVVIHYWGLWIHAPLHVHSV